MSSDIAHSAEGGAPTLQAPGFHFSKKSLRALALVHRDAYGRAKPFPHVVMDGFLGTPFATEFASVFPGPEHPHWKRRDHAEQAARLGQLQRAGFDGVHGALRHLLAEFSGLAFLEFLETLTGIEGLIPDPHFRGAGFHLTLRGGHLSLHADFNRDRFRALNRRLTVLYYLNPDWREEWGGALELWNPELTRREVEIAPALDRLVVMTNADDSWHGHPQPLACPENRGRAAVVAYFYTADVSPDAAAARSATWVTPEGDV